MDHRWWSNKNNARHLAKEAKTLSSLRRSKIVILLLSAQSLVIMKDYKSSNYLDDGPECQTCLIS